MWARLFQLKAQGKGTYQDQIRQTIVSAILDNRIANGSRVPSGRKLAEQLGVARNTVVLAYQRLVDEGYLAAQGRSGYFVSAAVNRASSDAQSSADFGKAPGWPNRLRFRPSRQRNIHKASNWQDYAFPFIHGQFDPELFPTNDWRECCRKTLSVMEIRDWAPDLFTRDDPGLVDEIRNKILPSRGVWASPDEIIITIGAQQALYLLADLLLGPRSVVGVENPGYPDARNIFASRQASLRALAVDGGGLVVDAELDGCDYVYSTPSHQSPTTVTMPMERRRDLLRRAEEADFVVIEDDYESETSFSGTPNSALKSLDRCERVIYVGSVSKTFAPGLRLGYIVAAKPLIEELRALRRLMIRHPSAFVQRSFALFLGLGHYNSLARKLLLAHRQRANALEIALARHLPEIAFRPIDGGTSFWLTAPQGFDCQMLTHACRKRGVLIEPGAVYHMAENPPQNHFRIGFASIKTERIEPGIRELAGVYRDIL